MHDEVMDIITGELAWISIDSQPPLVSNYVRETSVYLDHNDEIWGISQRQQLL